MGMLHKVEKVSRKSNSFMMRWKLSDICIL